MAKKRGGKMGKVNFGEILAVVAGGAVAGKVGNLNIPVNDKIKKALPLALGVVLTMQKNPTIKMVGLGMAGVGGVKLVAEFVPSLGIGAGMDMGAYELIEGPASNYALNGPGEQRANTLTSLSGLDLNDEVNTDNFS